MATGQQNGSDFSIYRCLGCCLDEVWLMEATKLFINNAEFVGIAIFSPRSWNNSVVGVIKFMPCLMIT